LKLLPDGPVAHVDQVHLIQHSNMKKLIYTAFALCLSLAISAQVSFQRLYDVVQDSTHILSDGIATKSGGFATLGSNIVIEGQTGFIHRAILTTYDSKGDILLAKDIYLADSTRLLSTSEIVESDEGALILSANLDTIDLSTCIVAVDGTNAEPLWSRRIADEFQFKVSLATMPDNEVLAGSTNLAEGLSIWLSRINAATGEDVWAKEYVALDSDSETVPADLFDLHVSTIDSSIYMTGQSVPNNTNLGFHTTKLDREGNVIWSTHVQSDPLGLNFQPLGITEATDTSTYVTGRIAFNDGVNLINSLFITKYDIEGQVVWTKTLTEGNSTFSNGNDIVAFGDNLVVSTLGTETGAATVSGMIEIDTSGAIVNSQVYRDSMTFFAINGGLSTTTDGGLAMFTTRFVPPLGLVSDIVKTAADLTTPCSSSDEGRLEDVPFTTQSLNWFITDFADSDTLQTDINNANYYDVPTISPTPDQWCPNEPIIDTLDATPSPLPDGVISYEWMGPGVDGAVTPFVVGMEEGEYMVTVTIRDKHCYTLCDTVNISRLQEPTVQIGQDFSQFCIDNSVNLIGQISGVEPFQSIEWSTGESDPVINILQEGTYSLTVVDDCMETATGSVDVVFPEELNTLSINSTFGNDCNVILTAVTNIDGSPDNIFTWTNSAGQVVDNQSSTIVTELDTYTVTVDNCDESLTENIVVDQLTSNPLNDVTTSITDNGECDNFVATLSAQTNVDGSGGITYTWRNVAGDIVGTSQVIEVTEVDDYTVTVNYCGVERNAIQEVRIPSDLEDLQFAKVFFPQGEEDLNQTFGPVIPCNDDIRNYSLKIYNRWGNEVFTSDDINVEWNGRQGDSPSPSAVYVWTVEYTIGVDPEVKKDKGDVTLFR